uniref:Uncharacterized protein n=1 Tax=Steinernema glaseri TaxID=37863 RepID=A0A1I7ZBH4_9BILA
MKTTVRATGSASTWPRVLLGGEGWMRDGRCGYGRRVRSAQRELPRTPRSGERSNALLTALLRTSSGSRWSAPTKDRLSTTSASVKPATPIITAIEYVAFLIPLTMCHADR